MPDTKVIKTDSPTMGTQYQIVTAVMDKDFDGNDVRMGKKEYVNLDGLIKNNVELQAKIDENQAKIDLINQLEAK